MLKLYVKTGCPYCAVAMGKLHDLSLPYEEKNIADPAVSAELVARGGMRQVPYLVDDARGVEMYESADIVRYLDEHYSGEGSGEKSAAPGAGGSCPTG